MMVSICMISYNHESFISEAIEGFMMQKTTFDFELIIGEDCSTDRTREICNEYKDKYPNKIELLVSEKNIGMMPNFIRTLNACTGKYIALCEGDDYWTDPYKLQKQVDFLEANDDFAICHHNMQVTYEDGRVTHLSNALEQKEVTTIEDLANGNYIFTASCVFRNGLVKELPSWFNESPVGDYVLHMLNAQFGKIKYLPDIMGVYRVHNNGLWESKDEIHRTEKWITLIDLMKNQFNPNINRVLLESQSYLCIVLIKNLRNDPAKCKYYSSKLIENNPCFLVELYNDINHSEQEIKQILNSCSYKLGSKIINPIRILRSKFKFLYNFFIHHKDNTVL